MNHLDLEISDQEIDDRIFALLGTKMTGSEIVEALGLEPVAGLDRVAKVVAERGTPRTVAIGEGIKRLESIRI